MQGTCHGTGVNRRRAALQAAAPPACRVDDGHGVGQHEERERLQVSIERHVDEQHVRQDEPDADESRQQDLRRTRRVPGHRDVNHGERDQQDQACHQPPDGVLVVPADERASGWQAVRVVAPALAQRAQQVVGDLAPAEVVVERVLDAVGPEVVRGRVQAQPGEAQRVVRHGHAEQIARHLLDVEAALAELIGQTAGRPHVREAGTPLRERVAQPLAEA
jgi:hypothetical protein